MVLYKEQRFHTHGIARQYIICFCECLLVSWELNFNVYCYHSSPKLYCLPIVVWKTIPICIWNMTTMFHMWHTYKKWSNFVSCLLESLLLKTNSPTTSYFEMSNTQSHNTLLIRLCMKLMKGKHCCVRFVEGKKKQCNANKKEKKMWRLDVWNQLTTTIIYWRRGNWQKGHFCMEDVD